MERATYKPKSQLDRGAWIRAATDVLAEQGIAGVRIEVLAKRCKVTKGSFYWHFKDRQDLLQAMLIAWKEGRIKDILKQTRAEPGQELPRLYHLIELYGAGRNRKGILVELAIRDWALRDQTATAVVQEVDAVRSDCARRLFLACGFSEAEASSRSLLLYAYVFGQSLMTNDRQERDIGNIKARIADLIARQAPQ